ncbi:MAG: hypothetical protein II224_06800, partial [Ruminococcus sp.]|nr:hypothetical protein [Ruminococcus sp.]
RTHVFAKPRLPQGFDTPLQVFSSKLNASIGGLDATSRCRIGCSVTLPKRPFTQLSTLNSQL